MRLIIGMAILAAVLVMPTTSNAAAAYYGDASCTTAYRSSVARILPPRCGCDRDDADCLQCCLCIRRGGRPQRCCM